MAERSKALRSGRSPVFRAWVRIPLLTELVSPPTTSQEIVGRVTWLCVVLMSTSPPPPPPTTPTSPTPPPPVAFDGD
ncbi:hypothetical protein Pmani_029435 [Petrolisthes manimaculis]|uniref:Uncharacterized protein n=1 Tax=Petrolisthes manimaculis TaxID=1843537 RepID=A0AAE1NXK8_9EUCA|nr:hypothetical protein Pmani_029435 [Petrolisthes manimaculis]